MNASAVDMKDRLVSAGAGTFAATTGWGIFISDMPPGNPDTAIALYDTAGLPPDPKWLLDQPGMMANVRGAKEGYLAGYAKALAVRDALLGMAGATVNSTLYVGVYCRSDIAFMQYDDNRRPVFSINFRIVREPASGTHRIAV